MTYAGLKSMIYAGLTSKDPRVKAAFEWIQRHYTVETNPGLGQQGLYYYYHTFAKALSVLKLDTLEDSSGKQHDWRSELTENSARCKSPTAVGSTKLPAGTKGTPTSPPPMPC